MGNAFATAAPWAAPPATTASPDASWRLLCSAVPGSEPRRPPRRAGPWRAGPWLAGPWLAAGAAAAAARGGRASRSRRCLATQAAAALQSAISEIDFRVGQILSAEMNDGSDKLLVELIDIGEQEPRQICSGISAFYKPEEIVGKRVIVVANLKERKMAGTASNGMVLCAHRTTADDVRELALVEAPLGAPVGERIVVEVPGEVHGPAAAANRVMKKKLYEKVCDDFRTDGAGVVCYKDWPFQTSVGPCCVKAVPNGIVS